MRVETVLKLCLKVDGDLEPFWALISDRVIVLAFKWDCVGYKPTTRRVCALRLDVTMSSI